MKKLYSTIMMLALMVAALSFTACGGGDDEESGGQETPSSSVKKCLIRVAYGNIIWDYTYDNQGRVIQIKRKFDYQEEGRVSYTYVYNNDSVIETIYENDYSSKITYTLENERISKLYDSDTRKTYEYNYKNGYLITETAPKRQLQYNWSDGNLMRVDYENENLTETYEYTNYICPQGFFPFGHYAHMCGRWGLSGLLGKTMKNLPSKHTEDDIIETYYWVIQDGLPIMMNRTVKEPQMSAYQTTYTFEWN